MDYYWRIFSNAGAALPRWLVAMALCVGILGCAGESRERGERESARGAIVIVRFNAGSQPPAVVPALYCHRTADHGYVICPRPSWVPFSEEAMPTIDVTFCEATPHEQTFRGELWSFTHGLPFDDGSVVIRVSATDLPEPVVFDDTVERDRDSPVDLIGYTIGSFEQFVPVIERHETWAEVEGDLLRVTSASRQSYLSSIVLSREGRVLGAQLERVPRPRSGYYHPSLPRAVSWGSNRRMRQLLEPSLVGVFRWGNSSISYDTKATVSRAESEGTTVEFTFSLRDLLRRARTTSLLFARREGARVGASDTRAAGGEWTQAEPEMVEVPLDARHVATPSGGGNPVMAPGVARGNLKLVRKCRDPRPLDELAVVHYVIQVKWTDESGAVHYTNPLGIKPKIEAPSRGDQIRDEKNGESRIAKSDTSPEADGMLSPPADVLKSPNLRDANKEEEKPSASRPVPSEVVRSVPVVPVRCERVPADLPDDGNPLLPPMDGRMTPNETLQNVVSIRAAAKSNSGHSRAVAQPGVLIGQDEKYAYVAGSRALLLSLSSGEWYRVVLRPWTAEPVEVELEPLGIATRLGMSFFRLPLDRIRDIPALVPVPGDGPVCAEQDIVFVVGYNGFNYWQAGNEPPVVCEAVIMEVDPDVRPSVKIKRPGLGKMCRALVLNVDGRLIGMVGESLPTVNWAGRTIRHPDLAELLTVPMIREAWYPEIDQLKVTPNHWDASGVDLRIFLDVVDPMHRVADLELAIGRLDIDSECLSQRGIGGYLPGTSNMTSVVCQRPLDGPRKRDDEPLVTWHEPNPLPPGGEVKYVVQLIGTGTDGHAYRSRPESVTPPLLDGPINDLRGFKSVQRDPRGGVLVTPEDTKVDDDSQPRQTQHESIPIPKPIAYPVEFPPPESTKDFADITWFTLLGQKTHGVWRSSFAWAPDGSAVFAISTANALNRKGASVVRIAVPEMMPTGLLPLPHKSSVWMAGSPAGVVVFANEGSVTFVYLVDPKTLEVRKRFAVPRLAFVVANSNSPYAYSIEGNNVFSVIDLESARFVSRTSFVSGTRLLRLSEDAKHLCFLTFDYRTTMLFRLEGEDVIWEKMARLKPKDRRIDPLYAKGPTLAVHVDRGAGGQTKATVVDLDGRQVAEFTVPTTACAAAFAPGSERRLAILGERNVCLVDLPWPHVKREDQQRGPE